MQSRVAIFAFLLAPVVVGAQSARQSGAAASDAKSWPTPYGRETRPRDPFADQKGRVWFVGQEGNYVAYLEPSDGSFKKYEIEPGTNPHNIVVDAKGTPWFTGNRNGRIVKLDPNTGKLTTYMMPDSAVRDPHTMIFDNNGDAWFTAQNAAYVGKLTSSTGQIRLWKFPARTRPYGIVLDSQGRPYFDLFGTNKLATIDPKTGDIREYTLPDSALPRRIAITNDTTIWYGDYRRGFLGRVNTKTGAIKEWALPAGRAALAYGMATDDRGFVWVAETGIQPNKVHAFDPKREMFVESIPIPAEGANTIRHMQWDKATRQIWFGGDANMIGRIKVAPVAVTP